MHAIFDQNCLHCRALKTHWYSQISDGSYQDIEENDGYRLKKYTGTTEGIHAREIGDNPGSIRGVFIDIFSHQPEGSPIVSSWPEHVFSQEQDFINHPEFKKVCELASNHGNNTLSPRQLEEIWEAYCDGESNRGIAKRFQVHNSAIFRAIKKITGWMHIMDDQDNEKDDTEKGSTVIVRAYNPVGGDQTDTAFIFSSWRNGLWYAEKRDERIQDKFYAFATRQIRKLISHPATKIRIACMEENPDNIVGYSVMTGPHVYWVYVKIDYRRTGIAKLLTQGFTSISTPATRVAKAIAHNLGLKIEVKDNESERIDD